jgi:hypothetical protein
MASTQTRAVVDRFVRAACAAVLLAACGGDQDPLESPEMIAGWANAASALGVFSLGHEPLSFADGQSSFPDPACPATSDDGTTVTITGNDCVDSDGTIWLGSATVVRTGAGDRSLAVDGYGKTGDPDIFSVVTGTFEVTEIGADLHEFVVDVGEHGGVASAILYTGTVQGTYGARTRWNGSGSVARSGGAIINGAVDATTVDQLRDDAACSLESLSGTTTMVSPEHTVVITYDGDTDCDDDNSARWSLDGVDQGLVTGVVCAIGRPGRGASSGAGAGLLLLALACLGVTLRGRRLR